MRYRTFACLMRKLEDLETWGVLSSDFDLEIYPVNAPRNGSTAVALVTVDGMFFAVVLERGEYGRRVEPAASHAVSAWAHKCEGVGDINDQEPMTKAEVEAWQDHWIRVSKMG